MSTSIGDTKSTAETERLMLTQNSSKSALDSKDYEKTTKNPSDVEVLEMDPLKNTKDEFIENMDLDFNWPNLWDTDSIIVTAGEDNNSIHCKTTTETTHANYVAQNAQCEYSLNLEEASLSPENPFRTQFSVKARLWQNPPNNRLTLRKDENTGLNYVKGGESIGISLNFSYKLTADSIDDLGYTGYVNIFMVHSDPDLYIVKVENNKEELPFTIDGCRHTITKMTTRKYGEVKVMRFHVSNTHTKTLSLKFNTLSSKTIKKFIPDGKIHASRQHNIIVTGNDINDDTCWVPIQVMAEVTGKSRAPEQKRRKKRALIRKDELVIKRIKSEYAETTQESGNAMLIQFRCLLQKLRDNPVIQPDEINMIYREVIVNP